ncbi:tRNA-dihydrouridine synthase B [Pseudohongiella nitratireducens]|uniref:tRNA-dihydrouridine synthase B n=1 Tax=Pseudohongiella nitratireducens TaxID=1768907 RepID=A0A917GKH8_9GAMM|nr:tRNA dihydrouridine synthase DusB [Pseudohongiella nitratireducens]GGG49682.1 tRNA-dihydrouridine synthase B [Pseudohongiella nitratireducens]|tara:strand:+ start:1030 stop:2016 length:987 start_codon:yes stop_codon:yes gene_type:complete
MTQPFSLGKYELDCPVILAPMVGVSDLPFREICKQQGATLTIAEMVPADTSVWHTEKNRLRMKRSGRTGPDIVQIAGFDPEMMAEAARQNVELGAEVIDINMGCPAKKVLKRASGSALLQDPELVESILRAVVSAVDVPVTLKTRTGWSRTMRNGRDIAKIAEDCGITMLSIHGRTRECRFVGEVEYDTIAEIKQAVSIPVIANGDINTPEQAKRVLEYTGADGVMIGRAAQGQPWIFRQINEFLKTGTASLSPEPEQISTLMQDHIRALHAFYGDFKGALFARKHIDWYSKVLPGGEPLKARFMSSKDASEQRDMLSNYHEQIPNLT